MTPAPMKIRGKASVEYIRGTEEDKQFYPSTPEIISAVRSDIIAIAGKIEGFSFLDIGAGDGRVLEGIAEDEAVASQIEEFVTLIESSVDEANSALNSNISFEVRSIQSSLNDSISELDNLFSQIQSASELQGSEDVVGMADNIKRFKEALVGSGNALDSRIMALEQEKKVHELLGEASENGKIVRERLVSLNQAITHYMKEVEEHSTASITTSKSITTILSFITLVLSVVIAYLVVQAINKPLKSVVKQLQLAAKGDMTVHFEKFHDDELGEMADNMQKLVDSLQATLVEIKENSDTLASTAEQTTTISEHSFSSISEQNQQIQMMSTSIEEMTATVDSVAGSIQ